MHLLSFAILIVLGTCTRCLQAQDEFHEELFVRPLASGHINAYFQFTTRWHYGERQNLHNTQLIPRPIAEILLQYDLKELHISLTQGLWRYATWGYPVVNAAAGAEVWAWFAAANLSATQVDEQWLKLNSIFSGILCASLNFIDKTNSVEPKLGFRPQFAMSDVKQVPSFVRYASLPREIVCTENLTPWKKLLPCNSKHGLASLLNSDRVHNVNYHSLSLKVRTICARHEQNCILEFTESVNLVYDPKLLNSNDFSLRRMFGQGLNGYCPLASSSKVYVSLDDLQFDLTPLPHQNITSTRGGSSSTFGVYDLQQLSPEQRLFNIAWIKRKPVQSVAIIAAPILHANRYVVARGQEKGQIVTKLHNNHYAALPIVLQEHIPWFVPVYMHTLKLNVLSKTGQVLQQIAPKKLHYVPGVQRTRAPLLELAFEAPAKSIVEISFDFDYTFLKWLEYPPDANHGHYIGSAVIFSTLPIARNYTSLPLEGYLFVHSMNASRQSYFLDLRTETLILSLPTPDFSMPYNVICLACTVVALAFGPIHSVATKRIVIELADGPPHSMLGKLFHKLFKRKKNAATVLSQDAVATDEILHEKSE